MTLKEFEKLLGMAEWEKKNTINDSIKFVKLSFIRKTILSSKEDSFISLEIFRYML